MHTWPREERLKLDLGILVPGACHQTNSPGNSLKNSSHQPGEGAVSENPVSSSVLCLPQMFI